MGELRNWKEITVIQRDPEMGCIPTGFEWLIRHHRTNENCLDTFQEDFNLQRKGLDSNNFSTIAIAIKNKHPLIRIQCKGFKREEGKEKIDFANDLLCKNLPCLLSLLVNIGTNSRICHIMPVVKISEDNIIAKNGSDIMQFSKSEVIRLHFEYWPIGNDLAWLEKPEANNVQIRK